MIIDTKGNIGLSFSGGIASATPEASASAHATVTNSSTIYNTAGASMDLEIGAGEVLVVSSTFTQMESGDQALSAKGGVGLGMPITGGADVQSTIVVGFNIFDIFAV